MQEGYLSWASLPSSVGVTDVHTQDEEEKQPERLTTSPPLVDSWPQTCTPLPRRGAGAVWAAHSVLNGGLCSLGQLWSPLSFPPAGHADVHQQGSQHPQVPGGLSVQSAELELVPHSLIWSVFSQLLPVLNCHPMGVRTRRILGT